MDSRVKEKRSDTLQAVVTTFIILRSTSRLSSMKTKLNPLTFWQKDKLLSSEISPFATMFSTLFNNFEFSRILTNVFRSHPLQICCTSILTYPTPQCWHDVSWSFCDKLSSSVDCKDVLVELEKYWLNTSFFFLHQFFLFQYTPNLQLAILWNSL